MLPDPDNLAACAADPVCRANLESMGIDVDRLLELLKACAADPPWKCDAEDYSPLPWEPLKSTRWNLENQKKVCFYKRYMCWDKKFHQKSGNTRGPRCWEPCPYGQKFWHTPIGTIPGSQFAQGCKCPRHKKFVSPWTGQKSKGSKIEMSDEMGGMLVLGGVAALGAGYMATHPEEWAATKETVGGLYEASGVEGAAYGGAAMTKNLAGVVYSGLKAPVGNAARWTGNAAVSGARSAGNAAANAFVEVTTEAADDLLIAPEFGGRHHH